MRARLAPLALALLTLAGSLARQHAVDVVFVGVLLAVMAGRRAVRPMRPLMRVAIAFVIAMVVAEAVHPSLSGMFTVWRWIGVVAVVAAAEPGVVVKCVGALAIGESVLALAQKLHGGPLGLPTALEGKLFFLRFGRELAPPGSMSHPYLLAAVAMLGGVALAVAARGRVAWLIAAAVAVAPVGFTYSRMAVVALVIAMACIAVARQPVAVLALAVGVSVPATVWSAGWVQRARAVTTSHSVNDLGSARAEMSRQSVTLIREDPIVGVGPGRYHSSLKRSGADVSRTGGKYYPVHNLPLLAAAEGGVAAGLLMVALLVAAGVTAARAGPLALATYGAFLPFCLLDHFPYTSPQGIMLTAMWLAAIATAGRATPSEWRRTTT